MRLQKLLLVVAFALLIPAYALAIDPGQASGMFETPSATIEVSYAAARLQPTIFDDGTTEVEIILSDLPVTNEDLEDDTIPFEQGYMSLSCQDGMITGFTLHVGYSSLGSGGGSFEGTLSEASVSGRYHSDGTIDIMDTPVTFDATFAAPVHNTIKEPFTDKDTATAKKSELTTIYLQYLRAEDGEGAKPFMSTELVRLVDEVMYGMISMVRADVPADDVEPLRVVISDESAVLYAKTSDQAGTIRFVKEDGAWKVKKEAWHYDY